MAKDVLIRGQMRIPKSTYRLQLNRDFTFRDLEAIVPYLEALGVSDIYSSPIFEARSGSTHGYDVVDPTRVNPELGTREELDRILEGLARRQMGFLMDIVPNHMATQDQNRWWMDVLTNGPASNYARFFDIDWSSSTGKPNLENKVLLPVLGRPYGEALEAGELKLVREDGQLWIRYFDHRFPLSKKSQDGLKNLARVNNNSEELDRILEQQFYRLADWHLAAEELNYRRFFDIGELIGVCVEDETVFEATHQLIRELVSSGKATGLRVDHVDGLHDPIGYLRRARHLAGGRETYLVVEKILDSKERLPDEMPVEGTTGYDFLNLVNSIFIDRKGIAGLRETYREFTGVTEDFREIVYGRKRRAVARLFAGEVNRLSRQLAALAAGDRVARDIPLSILIHALVDITSSLPVYRTYTNSPIVSPRDRAYIDEAVAQARRLGGDERRLPAYEFLRRLLVLDIEADQEAAPEWLRFVMQWQQLTGPAMAKGFEDTALYVYYPLLSLNEVGGDPELRQETTGLDAFHRRNQEFLQHWPHTLNATTTHDTKRSEGARSRLNVLSEIPEETRRCVRRWKKWNASKKRRLNGVEVPNSNEEFLLYQTLLGSWPLHRSEVPEFKKRLDGFIEKALREAKNNSSWTAPRVEYERAFQTFARSILSPSPSNRFFRDFQEFQPRIAFFAAINALSQLALKLTAPGVPDFYQGTEVWDFSMVDPDNRRPIEFQTRSRMLAELKSPALDDRSLLREWPDGRIKMLVTERGLSFRREHPELFASGSYLPLRARGAFRDNVIAFARVLDNQWSITVAPRFPTRLVRSGKFPLGETWKDTRVSLPREAPRQWTNVLTGESLTTRGRLNLSEVLSTLPVAILRSRS